MINAIKTYLGQGVVPKYLDGLLRRLPVSLPAGVNYAQGQLLGIVAGSGTAVNDVQTITVTGTPTGGTFVIQIGYLGVTVAIAYNASAATVQAALVTLVGTGNVAVTGGPGPGTPWVATFQGACAGLEMPLMTVYSTSLTGGASPAVGIVHTTLGNAANGHHAAYNSGASDGRQTPHFILQYPASTDIFGRIYFANQVGGMDWDNFAYTAPAWYGGAFAISDLVGLDSNALGIMGYLISGSGATDTTNGVIQLT